MNQEELDLIKGVFTSAEAKDILLCLIDIKSSFIRKDILVTKSDLALIVPNRSIEFQS